MKNVGYALLFFGIGSTALFFLGYEFRILSWIDNWGETTGWAIRGAMIVLGVILAFFGPRLEGDDGEPQAE